MTLLLLLSVKMDYASRQEFVLYMGHRCEKRLDNLMLDYRCRQASEIHVLTLQRIKLFLFAFQMFWRCRVLLTVLTNHEALNIRQWESNYSIQLFWFHATGLWICWQCYNYNHNGVSREFEKIKLHICNYYNNPVPIRQSINWISSSGQERCEWFD